MHVISRTVWQLLTKYLLVLSLSGPESNGINYVVKLNSIFENNWKVNEFFVHNNNKKMVHMDDERMTHGDDLLSYSNYIIPWVKVTLLDKEDWVYMKIVVFEWIRYHFRLFTG